MLVKTEAGNYVNLLGSHVVTIEGSRGNEVTIIPMKGRTRHLIQCFSDREMAQELMDRIAADFAEGRRLFAA